MMESRRVIFLALVLACLVATASAATCPKYEGKQAGARCGQDNCCVGPLWCDVGRCSARGVGDDEKLKQCRVFSPQPGDRCDINNALCCGQGMKCNVGRCSK